MDIKHLVHGLFFLPVILFLIKNYCLKVKQLELKEVKLKKSLLRYF